MVPVSLTLRNFLSYGEDVPALDFRAFRVACISGANGHGKSALLDAITWALWGEARKPGADRRPEQGLLRIGASEMQVDVEFDLGSTRYRVARNHRRTGRGSITRLELQVFDPDAGTYRTLSEGGSLRKTQERLSDLLSMTYDTFINSAFILQGRADEFTRRNARERKAILGEILGLSRYDALADLAKAHAGSAELEAAKLRDQVEAGRSAASRKRDLRGDIDALSSQIAELDEELEDLESRLEVLRQNQARLDLHRKEMADLAQECSRLEAERAEAVSEIDGLKAELTDRRRLIDRKGEILEAFERYQALQSEEDALQSTMRRRHELEGRCSDLEREIEKKRHEVQTRLEVREVQIAQAQREIHETDRILEDRESVWSGLSRLQEVREQDRALEQDRERRELLEQKVRECEQYFGTVRADRQLAMGTHLEEVRRLEEIASEQESLKGSLRDVRLRLDGVRQLEGDRDRIREQGASLAARIASAEERMASLTAEDEALVRQRDGLERLDEPLCPLCGSMLDQEHRAEVGSRLAAQSDDLHARLASLKAETRAWTSERETCRRRYQEVRNWLAGLDELSQEVARAEAAEEGAERAAQRLVGLRDQTAKLGAALRELETAPEGLALTAAREAAAEVAYDREAHGALRREIHGLAEMERRWDQILAAEKRREQAAKALPDILEKRDLARAWLEEGRYAPEAQAERDQVRAEINALGYSPEHHERVRETLTSLRYVPQEKTRLGALEQETAGLEARLSTARGREKALRDRLAAAGVRASELEPVLKSEDASRTEASEIQARLRVRRDTRDERLKRVAARQAEYERCETLADALEATRLRLKQVEKEVRVYRELVTAFGKDGIPSLIIEQSIPEMEEGANRLLSRLTDNRTHVSLESLRDLKKGGTRETLDIRISDELGERSYELYSGGEAFRIDFALRIALSQLLARRSGTRLCTLVVDEGFGTQDTEGLDHMVEAIQAVSEDFDKILVITHVESLKQAFPVRIEVTKHPDTGSRFEVLS
ncbi:MAG: AAA family ATPase [Candidatus Latescibacteria bacterium]|jgi:exonuclease SbcC|nr:AAA family ATPase [Candidatus Latescibacterota bacterium]